MRSLILVLATLLLSQCKQSTDPSNGDSPIRFNALDASCTEVWLGLKMADGLQPRIVTIRRALEGKPGDTVVYTGASLSSDTLLVDDGPNGPGSPSQPEIHLHTHPIYRTVHRPTQRDDPDNGHNEP